VRGWKTYTLYKPMNPPFYAPVYDLFASGAEIPAEISPMRLIEPEIMFRVDRDLPARDRNYDVAEIMESVTGVVGFEVIGSRFRAPSRSGGAAPANGQGSLLGSLSDHGANGCIVVGDAIPGWRDVAFEDVSLHMTDGDRELVAVVGCHPFDNPFLPVVVGVNRLRRHEGVKAGDIIVTNSSTSFFPVEGGSVIRAEYDGLGEVTATFAAS
jgi:2-keto-4-pentenoate hydratase